MKLIMYLFISGLMVGSCKENTFCQKEVDQLSGPACDSINSERLNLSFHKIEIFKLQNDFLKESNDELYGVLSRKDSSIIKYKIIFDSTVLKLEDLKNELITSSGGLTRKGDLINPNNVKYVNIFFYGKTNFGNNSYERFFKIIDEFSDKIEKISATSKFNELFNQRINLLVQYLNLKSKDDFFRDLTVMEAIIVLDRVITEIRIEEYKYLLQELQLS